MLLPLAPTLFLGSLFLRLRARCCCCCRCLLLCCWPTDDDGTIGFRWSCRGTAYAECCVRVRMCVCVCACVGREINQVTSAVTDSIERLRRRVVINSGDEVVVAASRPSRFSVVRRAIRAFDVARSRRTQDAGEANTPGNKGRPVGASRSGRFFCTLQHLWETSSERGGRRDDHARLTVQTGRSSRRTRGKK